MSYLRLSVDQTAVTYENWFTYTIDVSFNGLYGPLYPVFVKAFIPDTIEYILPTAESPIQSISETAVAGGTEITFDYGHLSNTGVATSISIKCRYQLSAPDTSSFIFSASLYITDPDTPYLTADASEVSLALSPYYVLLLDTVVPSSSSAASGGSVIYEVTLQNIGDQWAELSDFVITIDLDPTIYLTLDPSLTIVGKDISTTRYKDTSDDGITAVLLSSGNGFTFTLPTYRGQIYRFYFRAFIAADVALGTHISLSGIWSINGVSQADAQDILQIVSPSYAAYTSTTGPLQVQATNYMKYTNISYNSGNQDLTGVMLEFELPPNNQLLYFKLKTGAFAIEPIHIPLDYNYLLTYVTADATPMEYPLADTTHTDGYYSAASSSTLSLTNIIPSDRTVRYIRWYLGSLSVGATAVVPPVLEAYANSNLALGTGVSFHTKIYWYLGDGTQTSMISNFSTPVSLLSELYVIDHSVTPQTMVVPGNQLTFTSTISCIYSQLNNPVLLNLISDKMTFIQTASALLDNIYFEYYNGFTGVTINSTDNADIFPFPYAELVANYNNTTNTLLRLSYKNDRSYAFPQGSRLSFSFKTKINIGAIGTFNNYTILGVIGPYGSVSQAIDIYTETGTEDIDNDGYLNEQLAMSPSVSITISDFTSIAIVKESKGAEDSTYTHWPNLSHSISGGTVSYQLTILNNGNHALDTIELVDIIPHLNDTGVISINESRGSEFPIYQVTGVETHLEDTNGNLILPTPTITTYYSRSFDPVRFGPTGANIGTVNDWSHTVPDPVTTLCAYKVITSNRSILPGQKLVIRAACLIPMGVTVGKVAWNSFAVQATYHDAQSVSHTLLPVEPEKAGVTIINPAGTSSISGLVFFDQNKDGLYAPSDTGIDDVAVLLYEVQGASATLVTTTITTPDITGSSGHFIFPGITPGNYLIRFAPNFYKYTFSPQRLDSTLGSIVNPSTGYAPIIYVPADTTITNILSGLIDFRTTDFILGINNQAHKMLQSAIHSQMLLSLKLDEVISLIKPDKPF